MENTWPLRQANLAFENYPGELPMARQALQTARDHGAPNPRRRLQKGAGQGQEGLVSHRGAEASSRSLWPTAELWPQRAGVALTQGSAGAARGPRPILTPLAWLGTSAKQAASG